MGNGVAQECLLTLAVNSTKLRPKIVHCASAHPAEDASMATGIPKRTRP
jgi:hypothetical protein